MPVPLAGHAGCRFRRGSSFFSHVIVELRNRYRLGGLLQDGLEFKVEEGFRGERVNGLLRLSEHVCIRRVTGDFGGRVGQGGRKWGFFPDGDRSGGELGERAVGLFLCRGRLRCGLLFHSACRGLRYDANDGRCELFVGEGAVEAGVDRVLTRR
ncbi:MAG: hypothetical protein ED859_02920 [Desulfuromonadales bacterium]|nr:MAG: hypothetical protein ED859_02920 [Desulfuromonadales bacterium]